jgi:hypothetical protein
MPAFCAARAWGLAFDGLEGDVESRVVFRSVLSRSMEGEAARRAAREWTVTSEGCEW